MAAEILYPYALLDGVITHVSQARPGQEFTCVNPECQALMVPKMGVQRKYHFAHRVDTDVNGCGGESWLHRAAILAIKRGFERAVATDSSYCIQAFCIRHLSKVWECDLPRVYDRITLESTAVSGTRADILLEGASSKKVRPMVIEVIVTHSMTQDTIARYKQAGVVLTDIRPSIGMLEGYITGPVRLRYVWSESWQCDECIELSRLNTESITEERARLELELARALGSGELCHFVNDSHGSRTAEFYWCTVHRERTTDMGGCYAGAQTAVIRNIQSRIREIDQAQNTEIGGGT